MKRENIKLYYTAPKQEEFDEVKRWAINLWQKRYPEETHPHYAKEKVARIEEIENIRDNFMAIVGMFDIENQGFLALNLMPETRKSIRDRMIEGGTPNEYIVF